jgi:hypothetical protein
MIIFIKINESESLNINSIQSFTASEWEQQREVTEPAGSAKGPRHQEPAKETVLTIIRKGGNQVALSGASAEAALEILHQHGF